MGLSNVSSVVIVPRQVFCIYVTTFGNLEDFSLSAQNILCCCSFVVSERCANVILLKTHIHLGLTYLKAHRLESFVFPYSFLLGFTRSLFLKERRPNLPQVIRVRMWVNCGSELQRMGPNRTVEGERE